MTPAGTRSLSNSDEEEEEEEVAMMICDYDDDIGICCCCCPWLFLLAIFFAQLPEKSARRSVALKPVKRRLNFEKARTCRKCTTREIARQDPSIFFFLEKSASLVDGTAPR
jgi:hypothetical protein